MRLPTNDSTPVSSRAEVFVAEPVHRQRMAVGREETEEPSYLGLIRANRVRTAVGLELKPSDVFGRSGLQGEWHVEAKLMIMDRTWGLFA